ncbi:MAG: hypothetical protein LBI69_02455 [Puniceicoccales bacterium]|jgi:hypothetical protein|nr:hypothetical protein [Puniceicoccales bacterium]
MSLFGIFGPACVFGWGEDDRCRCELAHHSSGGACSRMPLCLLVSTAIGIGIIVLGFYFAPTMEALLCICGLGSLLIIITIAVQMQAC